MHLLTSFAAILLVLGTSVGATLVGVAPVIRDDGRSLSSSRLQTHFAWVITITGTHKETGAPMSAMQAFKGWPETPGFNGWEIGQRWREELIRYDLPYWNGISVSWYMNQEGANKRTERDVSKALTDEFGQEVKLAHRVPNESRINLVNGNTYMSRDPYYDGMDDEAPNPGSWPPWYYD